MLEASRLSFAHPGRDVLFRDVEIAFERGERIAVVGPNGSGKSTLLRCLSGILPPGSGSVRLDGLDPAIPRERPEALSRIGFLFDSPEEQFLAPTVEREIAFGLENRGEDPRRMRARVAEALERFSLSHVARRHPSSLSGGEGQRLALASIFATGPSYLFLDEPTSRLDEAGRREFEGWLASLDPRPAVIEATIRREQARRADRIVGVHEGRVVTLAPDVGHPLLEALVEDAGAGAALQIVPSGPVLLECRGLVHRPRGAERPLFANLAFEVGAGSILVIRGPNASGKTTLLRILAGFEKQDGGSVIQAPPGGREGRLRIGFLPQFPERLLFAPTVLEDVAFGPERLGRSAEEAVREARAALVRVGLGSERHERRFSGDLSEGERRRVAVAALVATSPDLVLLDEPEVGLDRPGRLRLRSILAGLAAEGGGIALSTHDAGWLAGLPGTILDLSRVPPSGAVAAA